MFSEITPWLAVASAYDSVAPGWSRLDVRGMIDGPGNAESLVAQYIEEGLRRLSRPGTKLVVVCDHGQSRSNLIAACIYARWQAVPVESAIAVVRNLHAESKIKPLLLNSLSLGRPKPQAAAPMRSFHRIAVTGANGFLGRRLCAALADQGKQVLPLSRSTHASYLSSSGALSDALEGQQPDCVIHLAHPKPYNSEETLQIALSQAIAVASYCEDRGVALLFPSSWTVFDGATCSEVTSLSPVCPHTRYGRLKAMIEAYLLASAREELDVRIVRLPAVFGHDSLEPRFLRYFADCIESGHDIIYHQFNNGSARVPLAHVDGCSVALVDALNRYRDLALVSHLATPMPTPDIKEIAASVAGFGSNTVEAAMVNRRVFTGHFRADIDIEGQESTVAGIGQFVQELRRGTHDLE